ncbi:MAG: alpha-galactosidase, partial [Bacteroidaceae bacterium]|nr:alpha-galactosidase [Bacteroidaceae bacterium]
MKIRHLLLSALLCVATLAHADEFIRVSTKSTDIVFRVRGNGRLYQSYMGRHLTDEADLQHLPGGTEAYLTHGMEDYFEPAIDVRHADGNASTLLTYV